MGSRKQHKARVLVVDDDPQVRSSITRALERWGVRVTAAATGEEAVALADGESFTAVVADIHMPGMGGIAMLQRMSPLQPKARFVILTGGPAVDAALVPRGHRGCVIAKPWNEEDLVDAVVRAGEGPKSTLPPPPSRKRAIEKVLLIEDDDADALLFETGLRIAAPGEFHVTRVNTLEAARNALDRDQFDAITLDLDLPDAFGLATIAKAQAAAPSVGLIVLSACDDQEFALRAVQAGAQDYLVKGKAGGPAIVKALRYAEERKRTELRIADMAFRDQLTGLANRTLFRQKIAQGIALARRSKEPLAVALIDMDRFKEVNDALGHDAGDTFLQVISQRLRKACRESDTVARLGGDEFAILAQPLAAVEDAPLAAERILNEIRVPLTVSGSQLEPTASVGVACYPESGADADELLAAADIAMYAAKAQGRNGVHIHGAELSRRVSARVQLTEQIRRAVNARNFEVQFQPQVNTHGRVLAAEALLRWKRQDGTLASGGEFVPTLEDTGLIAELGGWIATQVCQSLKRWRQVSPQIDHVALNLSARQIGHGDLVGDLTRAVDLAGLETSDLHLELTETALIHDTQRADAVLEELHVRGFKLVLDDFGTGYCSLAYLQRFPISAVKIDTSFVAQLEHSERARGLVGGIIHLAGRLGLNVVAEGVENPNQARILGEEGCKVFQGFLYGHSLPPDAFIETWLQQGATADIEPCVSA